MVKIRGRTKRVGAVDDLSSVVTGRFRLKEVERRARRLIHPLRHASKESVSVSEVEGRIMRACKTIRALPDPEWRFLHGNQISHLPVVREFKEAYGYDEAKARFHPKPRDVSDVLVALGWCNVLEREEFRLIWWRSFDISFGVIAARIGRSDEAARRRYKDAILRAYSKANEA